MESLLPLHRCHCQLADTTDIFSTAACVSQISFRHFLSTRQNPRCRTEAEERGRGPRGHEPQRSAKNSGA
jgi:hypothetical protein